MRWIISLRKAAPSTRSELDLAWPRVDATVAIDRQAAADADTAPVFPQPTCWAPHDASHPLPSKTSAHCVPGSAYRREAFASRFGFLRRCSPANATAARRPAPHAPCMRAIAREPDAVIRALAGGS